MQGVSLEIAILYKNCFYRQSSDGKTLNPIDSFLGKLPKNQASGLGIVLL